MAKAVRFLLRSRQFARAARRTVFRRPFLASASLYVTQRCNLRCAYCSSPRRRTPELPTAAWVRVADELARLGCQRVALLGGEPLLRADIGEIAQSVRARGMTCVLTTNGLLVPARIDALRAVDTLVLSLDAAGAENDALRGRGVYDAVLAALQAARTAGIPVKLNAVLSSVTAPALESLIEFAEREEIGLTVNLMRFGNPALWHDAAAHRAADAEMSVWLSRLAQLAREHRVMLFSPATYEYSAAWSDYGRDRLERDTAAADDARIARGPACHAGRRFITIDADGSAFPCALTMDAGASGNVVTGGLERALTTAGVHQCLACWSPCLVEQNSLFSGRPKVLAHFVRRHVRRYA